VIIRKAKIIKEADLPEESKDLVKKVESIAKGNVDILGPVELPN
jgi:hypothetical protein